MKLKTILLFLTVLAVSLTAHADEHSLDKPWEVGATFNPFVGTGTPTNDMIGAGIVVKRAISDKAKVAFGFDMFSGFDFERPAETLGIQQATGIKAIDATGDKTSFSLWYEGALSETIERGFYWKAGASLGLVDVGTASGATASGGTFNISTDAGTEFAVLAGIGYSASLTENLNFNASFDVQENFADWTLTDSVSGASGSVGNYLTYGLRIGFNYRW